MASESDAKVLEDAIQKLSDRLKTNSLHLADVENKKDITATINGLTTAFSGTRKYYASKILTILEKIKAASAIGSSATEYLPKTKTGFFNRQSKGVASAKNNLNTAGDIEAGKYEEFGKELANLKEYNGATKKIIYVYQNPITEEFWKTWFGRMTTNTPIYFSNDDVLPLGGETFEVVINQIIDKYKELYSVGGGAANASGGSSSKKTRNRRRRRRRATRRW